MPTVTGHCLCGDVKFNFENDKAVPDTAMCHCDSCQRLSGGPYSHLVGVPGDKLKWEGSPKTWVETTDSGNKSTKYFCSNCGCPVAQAHAVMAPLVFVRAGALEKEVKKQLAGPGLEVWTKGKEPWVKDGGAQSFTGMPEH